VTRVFAGCFYDFIADGVAVEEIEGCCGPWVLKCFSTVRAPSTLRDRAGHPAR